MVRLKARVGIGPTLTAYKTGVLPLNYGAN